MINLKDIFSNYIDFIYSVGYFGEYIAFIVTIILIFNFKSYLIIYIIMFVLNKTINEYFKNYFKQARPENPRKFLESDKFSKYDRPTKFEKNPKTYYKYNQDENKVETLDDEEISNDDYDRP